MTEDSRSRPRLAVLLDGAPLAEEEARALWTGFSAHMDEHRGDMAGFAKLRGYHEVRPEYQKGQAVLIVSTTAEAAAKAAPPPPPKPAAKPAKKPAPKPAKKPATPKTSAGARMNGGTPAKPAAKKPAAKKPAR